jgi:cytochrome c oxidase subunit IV
MHGRTISVPTYVLVCGVLVALTFLTLSVSFLHLGGVWHVVVGLLIGAVKASLVVLFFMHVLISPRLTWIVVIVSVFWLGVLIGLTLTDYMTRGQVPYMPGH